MTRRIGGGFSVIRRPTLALRASRSGVVRFPCGVPAASIITRLKRFLFRLSAHHPALLRRILLAPAMPSPGAVILVGTSHRMCLRHGSEPMSACIVLRQEFVKIPQVNRFTWGRPSGWPPGAAYLRSWVSPRSLRGVTARPAHGPNGCTVKLIVSHH